ncbi:MAG: B12-binding domain-containing protein [Thermoguttaceae bacterium]
MCDNTDIKEAILSGNAKAAEELTQRWLSSGRSARELRDTALSPAIEAIREQYARQAFYLPELLVSLRAAKAALSAVDAAGGREQLTCGKVVVGSLAWNGHGMCRDTIANLLEVCGWDVVDLGGDVSPAQFADVCANARASVLVVVELPIASGRMSSRVPCQEVAALVEEMEARGIRQRTRILFVGLAADSLPQGLHEVDAICGDLMEVPSSVQGLVKRPRAASCSC